MARKNRIRHGMSLEMLLLSASTSTRVFFLIGTLQVFSNYEEKGNLFIVVITPSGSGKTLVCHLGRIDLIM